jgi:hypothetical protein
MPITAKERDLCDIRGFFDSLDKIRAEQSNIPTAGDYSRIARLAIDSLRMIVKITDERASNPAVSPEWSYLADGYEDDAIETARQWFDCRTVTRSILGM